VSRYKEFDLTGIKTYFASERKSKFDKGQIAKPPHRGMSLREFFSNLPSVLKVNDLKSVALAVIQAKKYGKPIVLMFGGHIIKTGCSSILIDLAENNFITHFASNGSAAIHDVELAAYGHTSEDVESGLKDGSFGMASDTAAIINEASERAVEKQEGFGEAVGAVLNDNGIAYSKHSILCRSYQLGIPYTLHIALGTDVVHQHPAASGSAIGEASMRDFLIFMEAISNISEGGVVLNMGSAVIMPEVFLKALTVARNIKGDVKNFTTANLDMIQHYRPSVNVLKRPEFVGGKSFSITGHHEIMIPLLAALIYDLS